MFLCEDTQKNAYFMYKSGKRELEEAVFTFHRVDKISKVP